MNEHKIDINELYDRLKSTPMGLNEKEEEQRLVKYGYNILKIKKQTSLFVKFLRQFTNFFAILLIVGSILSFLAEYLSPGEGNMYIGIALFVVVILNAVFTFVQEYQSERIMESFNKMMPANVEVLRGSRWIQTQTKNIVPGDIIYIQEGDKIPADARLIEQNNLKVDNSSITGESEPQLRKLECTHDNILESRNMVFSGSLVQTGNGKALVYGTGMNTQIGKIVKLTKETKEVDTPLHKELKHFIKIISTIAMTTGLMFFIISLVIGKPLIGSIIFAIGIIVANVPEGLLPTVTLSLSLASKRMAKKNALVKNLESVETLGSTTVICTDKTGTLTENKMSVEKVFINLESFSVDEKSFGKEKGLDVLVRSMVLCNNSKIQNDTFTGDPTETALLSFSKNFTDINLVIKENVRVHETPFDSKTKRMITTNKTKNNKMFAYIKGAPEVIIKECVKILVNGEERKISDEDKKLINKYYNKLASEGNRVLAFAYKQTDKEKIDENNYVFVALSGMMDPPRKEIPDAILKCKSAGIKVIMMTGDYSLTAEAIGKKVGLIDKKPNIITGEKLDNLNDEQLKEILKRDELIFARTNPVHKLRIVKLLQRMGETVTVTGDGVNDAPALKNADMGVAMGLCGTEVAREASKMVLMDDNFATIVSAIEEGRTIFENIKKFIAYILTSNIPEILPFIAFILLAIPLPLTVILILSIDLGTDLIPALGLANEGAESDVMKKRPRPRSERLLSMKLLFMSYGIIGMIQAAAGFFSYFYILVHGGWHFGQNLAYNNPLYLKAVSGFFASIIVCQIADVLICKKRRQTLFKRNFFQNKLVFVGILTELVLLSIIIYFPYANKFFGTAPLSLFELSLSLPFALLILVGDEIRKFFVRRENKFVCKYLSW